MLPVPWLWGVCRAQCPLQQMSLLRSFYLRKKIFQFLLDVNGHFRPTTWVIQQKIITCVKNTYVMELILRNSLMSQSRVPESAVLWQMLFLALWLFCGFLEASYFTLVLHSEKETLSPDGHTENKTQQNKQKWQTSAPWSAALPLVTAGRRKNTAEFGFREKSGENTGTRDARNGKLCGSSKNVNPLFFLMDVFL